MCPVPPSPLPGQASIRYLVNSQSVTTNDRPAAGETAVPGSGQNRYERMGPP